jgi:hypothetical protein
VLLIDEFDAHDLNANFRLQLFGVATTKNSLVFEIKTYLTATLAASKSGLFSYLEALFSIKKMVRVILELTDFFRSGDFLVELHHSVAAGTS